MLVYKDCKKNIHRVKLRTDRKNANNNVNNTNTENTFDLSVDVDDQFLKDNLNTMEKMHRLRAQLEMKKRDKGAKQSTRTNYSNLTSIATNDIDNSFKSSIANAGNKIDDENGATACSSSVATNSPNTSKIISKYCRRIYLPPLKGFIDTAAGSSTKKNSRCESDSFVNDGSSNILLNNSNSSSSKQITFSKASKSNLSDAGAAGCSSAISRSDDTIWPMKVINETIKSKRKLTKSNWIQNLIEIMKTSKVPLSPSEIIEIKESFDNIRESITKENGSSSMQDERNNGDELKAMPYKSSNSESYRSKIRENIRRNRSFKSTNVNDLFIEEDRVCIMLYYYFYDYD